MPKQICHLLFTFYALFRSQNDQPASNLLVNRFALWTKYRMWMSNDQLDPSTPPECSLSVRGLIPQIHLLYLPGSLFRACEYKGGSRDYQHRNIYHLPFVVIGCNWMYFVWLLVWPNYIQSRWMVSVTVLVVARFTCVNTNDLHCSSHFVISLN